MTYYDILVKEGRIGVIKKFIELQKYGTVTDSIETKSFSLIRADLHDEYVGYVLRSEEVLSIEKPTKCSY